ncbi:hypothetical protein GCM10010236_35020 [Streptomyces eurythermus]|nr:hypothetical protein GCM10010236_35020 [Streptomyces eurythermus]
MVDRKTDSRSGPACSFISAVSATRFLVSTRRSGARTRAFPAGSAAGVPYRPCRALPRAFLSGRLPRIARKMQAAVPRTGAYPSDRP